MFFFFLICLCLFLVQVSSFNQYLIPCNLFLSTDNAQTSRLQISSAAFSHSGQQSAFHAKWSYTNGKISIIWRGQIIIHAHTRSINLLHTSCQVCWEGIMNSQGFQTSYTTDDLCGHWALEAKEKNKGSFFSLSVPKHTGGKRHHTQEYLHIKCLCSVKQILNWKTMDSPCLNIVLQNNRTVFTWNITKKQTVQADI